MGKPTRQADAYEKDLAEQRIALAAEMRACPQCEKGELSSISLHLVRHKKGGGTDVSSQRIDEDGDE